MQLRGTNTISKDCNFIDTNAGVILLGAGAPTTSENDPWLSFRLLRREKYQHACYPV